MEKQDELLVLQHLCEDSELRDLWKDHQNFEQKSKKMENKPYLSPKKKSKKSDCSWQNWPEKPKWKRF